MRHRGPFQAVAEVTPQTLPMRRCDVRRPYADDVEPHAVRLVNGLHESELRLPESRIPYEREVVCGTVRPAVHKRLPIRVGAQVRELIEHLLDHDLTEYASHVVA